MRLIFAHIHDCFFGKKFTDSATELLCQRIRAFASFQYELPNCLPEGWNNPFRGSERPSVVKRLFEPVMEMTGGNFQVL